MWGSVPGRSLLACIASSFELNVEQRLYYGGLAFCRAFDALTATSGCAAVLVLSLMVTQHHAAEDCVLAHSPALCRWCSMACCICPQLENAQRMQKEAAADRQAAEMIRRQMAAAQGAADGGLLKQLMGLPEGPPVAVTNVSARSSLRLLAVQQP